MSTPLPPSQATYLQDVAQAMDQNWGTGLSMHSSFLGKSITPDENSQTMLEYWLHQLAIQTKRYVELADAARQLCEALISERASTGTLSAASVSSVGQLLSSLSTWSFRCNGILEEAWERSIMRTRSGRTYAKVGSKFADNYATVLRELSTASPGHNSEIQAIGTAYVNKHHLMLKSLHPTMQILHENLLHAGLGSAATGNSDFHKAMHELTALNGKLDYSKMDPEITAIIQNAIAEFERAPGHQVFQ